MKTKQTQMELVAYQKVDDKKVKTYQLLHYNEKNTLGAENKSHQKAGASWLGS